MVEFALVAMLLFVILLGIIDYGLLLKDYLALSQVAREGVRTLAVGGTPDINTLASRFGLTGTVASTITPGAEKGDQTSVALTYNHNMVTGLFGSTKPLSTTMVMRRE
jgi:Flp pilus assembly protein TadG